MDAINDEVDKVQKKQKLFHKTSIDECGKLVKKLQQAKSVLLMSSQENVNEQVKSIVANVTKHNADIQSSVKDYYGALNKLGKSIEKKFNWNLDLAGHADSFAGMDSELDMSLALHLIRQGMFEQSDLFADESKLQLPAGLKDQFILMFDILKALKAHDLHPALKWCQDNADALSKRSSSLEFQLHKLQFIALLTGDQSLPVSKRTLLALQYSRQNFGKFGDRHLKEIQKLMGSLAYASSYPWHQLVQTLSGSDGKSAVIDATMGLHQSPYAELVSMNLWSEIEAQFMTDFCMMLGFAQNSPLNIIVDVGAPAIPTMMKMQSVMDERRKERPKVEMWTVGDELPVEIPLSKQNRYHSIFVCPVSREQASRSNPPMMLACGHIISRESLARLAKGGKPSFQTGVPPPQQQQPQQLQQSGASSSSSGSARPSVSQSLLEPQDEEMADVDPLAGIPPSAKIKCPYCPTETIAEQVLLVSF